MPDPQKKGDHRAILFNFLDDFIDKNSKMPTWDQAVAALPISKRDVQTHLPKLIEERQQIDLRFSKAPPVPEEISKLATDLIDRVWLTATEWAGSAIMELQSALSANNARHNSDMQSLLDDHEAALKSIKEQETKIADMSQKSAAADERDHEKDREIQSLRDQVELLKSIVAARAPDLEEDVPVGQVKQPVKQMRGSNRNGPDEQPSMI